MKANETTPFLIKEKVHDYSSIRSVTSTGSFEKEICNGYETNNQSKNKLIKVLFVSFGFFLIELVGGILSGSLALLSDSFHLLSDVVGFLISLIAIIVSQRKATKKYSFGFHRAEIIGAMLSLILIWVLTIGLIIGAIDRLRNPVEINAKIMLITAIIGVLINITLAFTLEHDSLHCHGHEHIHIQGHDHGHERVHEDMICEEEQHHHNKTLNDKPNSGIIEHMKKENINVKAAVIHILGDLLSSVGVVIAATVIYFDSSKAFIDPICTFIFAIIVLFTTIDLFKQSLSVIMESTPEHIDSDEVIKDILNIKGISDIHDLHIWNITVRKPAIAAHIVVNNDVLNTSEYRRILNNSQYILCKKYGIHHTTLQIEYNETAYEDDLNKIVEEGNTSGGDSVDPQNDEILEKKNSSNDEEDTTYIDIDIEGGDREKVLLNKSTNYSNYCDIHCKSNLCC